MMRVGEMRKRAWKTLSGKWFMRLALVGLVLFCLVKAADVLVIAAFREVGITTLGDFVERWASARQQGLCYSLPTARAAFWMGAGFVFEMFIAYVFSAILAFGMAGLALKAEANRDGRWFADSFGGFARPLEMTGLMLSMNVKAFLWSLLLLVPGVVAVYRYRLAWYLKCERPDMKAGECIAESGRLMKGRKWKAFCLDCSFAWWWLLVMAALAAVYALAVAFAGGRGPALGAASSLAASVASLFAYYLLMKVMLAMLVSRAVFYREVMKEASA